MLLIVAVVATLAVGLAVKLLTDRGVLDDFGYGAKRITRLEFAIGALICALVVVPVTVIVGNKLALANNLTFHEYWNGYETAALRSDIECHRDGSCHFTYRCDPYEVVDIVTVPNADGKGTHTETRTHTEYHSCPEATVEWDFTVQTTLGDFHIERTFTDNPQPFRGDSVRGDVRRGTPPFWQSAADRVARGDPGPVTVRKDYENYILASQSTILHKHSDDVERFRSIMPAPASAVRDFYGADKAYFVNGGLDPAAEQAWRDQVLRFGAAFGTDLQGDLHVVIARLGAADGDPFTGALEAYWTGPAFGRDALSKNALVIVLGTDGADVTWARAFTGMPRGNEALLTDLQRELPGHRLDPDLLGSPKGQLADGKIVAVAPGDSLVARQVWGPDQFARVSMHGAGSSAGGYTYLGGDIQPTTGQKWLIVGVAGIVSLIVWTVMVVVGTDQEEEHERDGIRTRREWS